MYNFFCVYCVDHNTIFLPRYRLWNIKIFPRQSETISIFVNFHWMQDFSPQILPHSWSQRSQWCIAQATRHVWRWGCRSCSSPGRAGALAEDCGTAGIQNPHSNTAPASHLRWTLLGCPYTAPGSYLSAPPEPWYDPPACTCRPGRG